MKKKQLRNAIINEDSVVIPEWRVVNSIYKLLSESINNCGELNENACNLPVEEFENENTRCVPGLYDTIVVEDDHEKSKVIVKKLIKLLKKIAIYEDRKSENEFFKIISKNINVVGIIDEFIISLYYEELKAEPCLLNFAKDLALRTDRRNVVKFGIIILGFCSNKSVINQLKILGLNDEFTVYVTLALYYLLGNPVNELWELAKKVHGWGRIRLIDKLVKMEINDKIRDWLIFEGYKNSITNSQSALTCAEHGLLHIKLENENIERNLFKSAANILDAMVFSLYDTNNITEYRFAHSAIPNFVRHAKQHAIEVSDYVILNNIKIYLTEVFKDVAENKNNAWPQDLIANCLIDIVEINNGKDWKQLTLEGLKSKDNLTYFYSLEATKILNIDTCEAVWNKLLEDPIDYVSWMHVLTCGGATVRVNQIINLFKSTFPLDEFDIGPTNSTDIILKYECLGFVTTFLKNYPGMGEDIIIVALNCTLLRNRNKALYVLEKWKEENWSDEIKRAINHLKEIEPDNDIKENIIRLLKGEELQ